MEWLILIGVALILYRLFSSPAFMFVFSLGFVYLTFRWDMSWHWTLLFVVTAVVYAYAAIERYREE